jgi:hypothetical protein
MKVYIGPYRDWFGPYQIADAIFFWVDRRGIFPDDDPRHERWDYKAHDKFGDWLNDVKWLVNLCQWIESKKERKIKVRIDRYDTWSMDHTLALIVHPMLVQLHATNHGYGCVDIEDAPHIGEGEHGDNHSFDSKAHERWNWVMEEMIWTFNALKEDQEYELFHTESGGWDHDAMKAHNERIKNGLRLFGKYYRGLWD